MAEQTSLWVFGYGSLVWKPGFHHGQTAIGYIEGYSRKLWQGNETHRGVPGKPGRVATLIEDAEAKTYGLAMELRGDDALDYLNNREMTLGGYSQKLAMFYPAVPDAADEAAVTVPAFPVLVFIATPESKHWLGPAPDVDIAKQVANSSGPSGHNVEYVVRLAQWIRINLPSVWDDHLFNIEAYIVEELKVMRVSLESLLPELPEDVASEPRAASDHAAPSTRPASYSATCQTKSLRCVKL